MTPPYHKYELHYVFGVMAVLLVVFLLLASNAS